MKSDQIFAEVVCPMTSRTYDFVLSSSTSIGVLKELILREISAREGNAGFDDEKNDTELFSSEYHLPLDTQRTLNEYGLKSGCRLMIV